MKLAPFILVLLFFVSCEEQIHIDLNTGSPRYVIEADLNNFSTTQIIRVSQTVSFDSQMASKPIHDAIVEIQNKEGRIYRFNSMGDGRYINNNLKPVLKTDYSLLVNVGGETFQSTERMHDYVNIDSIGVLAETIFDEKTYSIILKFEDPANEENQYKYMISVNQQPIKFLTALNDKFNNGLNVTHSLRNFNEPFEVGDTIVVYRQLISKPVYNYWNEIQMLNPGSAAPSNPKSNISNGAFGYFSISNTKEYGVRVKEVLSKGAK